MRHMKMVLYHRLKCLSWMGLGSVRLTRLRSLRLFGLLALWGGMLPGQAAASADIAVTLPPLAGLIVMLDPKAKVMCLLANGSDPHHFQLTPRKIEALQRTGLLVRSSFDDGGWPLPPKHAHSLDVWPERDHAWLDPDLVRQALPRIAQALSDLHPDRSADIQISLALAIQQVSAIQQSWNNAVAVLRPAGVVMQHPAWRRFMLAMHVPVLDVLESGHHGHEYGPHKLEHALQALHDHPGAWLIADQGHSHSALDWLQQHANRAPQKVELNALGSCGQSWPDLMHENIQRLQAVSQP